jgi:hypothetical protein
MQYCVETWLVALSRELPADPGVAYTGNPPIVGCNHVVCDGCGAVVRHVDGRSPTTSARPVEAELQALYASAQPERSPLFYSRPLDAESRVYFCRCNWYGVGMGRAKWVNDLDQPWRCGGHPSDAGERADFEKAARERAASEKVPREKADEEGARHAEAKRQVEALKAATVPRPASKIRFVYAPGVNPEFSTAAELRDSLLASYPDAAHFGGPVVGVNRDDTLPAWGWTIRLIAQRSDWWPALGIALQHAVNDGGDLARTAFATLMADKRDMLALLSWTEPLVEAFPDTVAPGSGTGWGVPDFRLETIVRDQKKSLAEIKTATNEAFLSEHGPGGSDIEGPFTNEDDLRALLVSSARAGQFPDGTDGPWSWIGFELIVGEAWLRPALVHAVSTIDTSDQPTLFALLDWFSEERDLWQFVPLLENWFAHHPDWWETAAMTKPKGWKWTMRSAHWKDISTLGTIVREALRRARGQVITPPIMDLPVLYGPSIS